MLLVMRYTFGNTSTSELATNRHTSKEPVLANALLSRRTALLKVRLVEGNDAPELADTRFVVVDELSVELSAVWRGQWRRHRLTGSSWRPPSRVAQTRVKSHLTQQSNLTQPHMCHKMPNLHQPATLTNLLGENHVVLITLSDRARLGTPQSECGGPAP